MECIIVNRISSANQKDGYSLDAQERYGRLYAEDKKFQILKEYSFQETASKYAQRKKFGEILDFISQYSKKTPLIVVAEKPDRIGRNHRDKEFLQDLFLQGKIEIHYYKESKIFDKNSDPSMIFMDDV